MIGKAKDDFEELWKGIFERLNNLWDENFKGDSKPWEGQ
jgi:hypothetical protein